jgi:hypothetical protein
MQGRLVVAFVAGLVVGAVVAFAGWRPQALGQQARQAGAKERTYRVWEGRHFENTRGNTWVEKAGDAKVKWTEIRRTDNFVELTQDGADGKEHFMRLFDDRAEEKTGRSDEWASVYTGGWGEIGRPPAERAGGGG